MDPCIKKLIILLFQIQQQNKYNLLKISQAKMFQRAEYTYRQQLPIQFSLISRSPGNQHERHKQNMSVDDIKVQQNEHFRLEFGIPKNNKLHHHSQYSSFLTPQDLDLQLNQASRQLSPNQQQKQTQLPRLFQPETILQEKLNHSYPRGSGYSQYIKRSIPHASHHLIKHKMRHKPLSTKKRPSFPLSILLDQNYRPSAGSIISSQSIYPRVYDKYIAMQFQYPEKVNDFVIESALSSPIELVSDDRLKQNNSISSLGKTSDYAQQIELALKAAQQQNKKIAKLLETDNCSQQKIDLKSQVLSNLDQNSITNQQLRSRSTSRGSQRQSQDKKMIFHGSEIKVLKRINKQSANQIASKIEELPFRQHQQVALPVKHTQEEQQITGYFQDENCALTSLPKQPLVKSFFSKRQVIEKVRNSIVSQNFMNIYR